MSRIPVFRSERHVGYRPDVEVQCGVALPAFDRPERYVAVLEALATRDDVELREATEHGTAPLLAVHDADMLAFLETCWEELSPLRPDPARELLFPDTFPHPGFGASVAQGSAARVGGLGALGRWCFDTITGIGPETYDAARASTDCALSAAEAVLGGAPLALALCRPPGHHAGRAMFGGGTFLNNTAIAAQALRTGGHARVAVLDVDFHHANGTQDIFYERDDVVVASLHGAPSRTWPFFSGWEEERGAGAGLGSNINSILPVGIAGPEYRQQLAGVLDALRACAPTAIVIALGFDTAAGDPAGDASLTAEDFTAVGADLRALGLPMVAVTEGGYQPEQIGGFVGAWLDGASG